MGLITRLTALLLITASAWAADGVRGHAFEPGDVALYAYGFEHSVSWQSADDRLTFTTALDWQCALVIEAAADGRITATATVLSLRGHHRGPGSDHEVDIRPAQGIRRGADDPLLGSWALLVDTPLTIGFDRTTGEVTTVGGQEALVAAYVAEHSAHPSQAARHRATAQAAFAEDRLAALWTRLLELPGDGSDRVPLGEPFASGQLERSWNGNRYRLSLAEDAEAPRLILAAEPVPIELVLSEASGEGGISTGAQGQLLTKDGSMQLVLSGSAQTQPVTQEHRLSWHLTRLDEGGHRLRREAESESESESESEDGDEVEADLEPEVESDTEARSAD